MAGAKTQGPICGYPNMYDEDAPAPTFYIAVKDGMSFAPSPEMGTWPTREGAERRMWEIQESNLYWQGKLEVKESKQS